MQTDAQGNALPKGIFYDPKRKRYRVRLYYRRRVVFLSYAHSFADAMAAYDAGLQAQADVRKHGSTCFRGTDGYINALTGDYV